jgi:DNA-binding MarR family transcriptional regulator
MDKTTLIKEIVDLQKRLNRVLRQNDADVWMALNLTIAQLKSLFFIANKGSINSKKLAAALGVTPADVTGIVDRLVDQGLVDRAENPGDRRMLSLRPTGKGEALIADLRERTIGHMSKVMARLSVDELAIMAQGLKSLAEAAETYQEEAKNEHD